MKPKKTVKEKTFKVRFCPKCKSDDVCILIGGEFGMWECKSCKFQGKNFQVKELNEEEYFDYLDKKGVEMPELGEPETVEEKKSHKDMLKEKMKKGEEL
jgi:hypothetical protein